MFNPERLLGGLLSSGMRGRSGLGSLMTGGAALGLVGVAMEAVEHFLNKPQAAPTTGVPPGPVTSRAGAASPPPPPGQASMPPPPPTGAPGKLVADQRQQQSVAILLIRAMIAAANADGVIDDRERANILQRLQTVQISEEEKAFLAQELSAPQDTADLAEAASSMELARKVYMVSLLAIEVDTEAERQYMEKLALALGLDHVAVSDIRRQFGLTPR